MSDPKTRRMRGYRSIREPAERLSQAIAERNGIPRWPRAAPLLVIPRRRCEDERALEGRSLARVAGDGVPTVDVAGIEVGTGDAAVRAGQLATERCLHGSLCMYTFAHGRWGDALPAGLMATSGNGLRASHTSAPRCSHTGYTNEGERVRNGRRVRLLIDGTTKERGWLEAHRHGTPVLRTGGRCRSAGECGELRRRLQWPHLDDAVRDRTRGLRDEADRLFESGGLDDRRTPRSEGPSAGTVPRWCPHPPRRDCALARAGRRYPSTLLPSVGARRVDGPHRGFRGQCGRTLRDLHIRWSRISARHLPPCPIPQNTWDTKGSSPPGATRKPANPPARS